MVPQQPDRHLRALDATAANDLAQPLFQPADALYWQSKGDESKMQAYLARCAEVKAQFPKPSVE